MPRIKYLDNLDLGSLALGNMKYLNNILISIGVLRHSPSYKGKLDRLHYIFGSELFATLIWEQSLIKCD